MPQNTSELIDALKAKDADRIVQWFMRGFEENMAQQQTARTDYLGGMQETNEAYLSEMEGLGAQRQAAASAYQQPHKMGTGEKILMGASAALPLLSMGMKRGRGRDVVGGMGALAAGIQRGGIQGRQKAREERLGFDLGDIEAQAGLMGKRHQLGTEYGKAEYDTQIYEYPERMGAMKDIMGLLPKPEKEPFTPHQQYQMGRNAAADARKRVLTEANQIIQSLDLGGQRFSIKSVQDLDAMIFELEQGDVLQVTRGLPPAQAPPRANVVAPILARLRELRDQYDTGETFGGGQTGKPPDMTEAEWQEYLQMKGM